MASNVWLWIFGAIFIAAINAWFRQQGETKNRTRQEIATSVAEIKRLVSEIESDARMYYELSGADPNALRLAAVIKSNIHRLGTQAHVCSRQFPGCVLPTRVKQFRQAVTGGDFDGHLRTQKLPNDPVFDQISAAARNIELDLDSSYQKHFQK